MPPRKHPNALTEKEKRFTDEYLIDLNATQAAIRAGYSPAFAATTARDLMKRQPVKDVIDRKIAERSRRTGITADRVLQELAMIGFMNPSKFIDLQTGKVREDADEAELVNIASVKRKTTSGKIASEEYEVKTQDKVKALELLGRHTNAFDQDVQAREEGVVINQYYCGPEELERIKKLHGETTEDSNE